MEITITGRGRRAQGEIRRRAAQIAAVRQVGPAARPSATSCLVAYYPGAQVDMEQIPGGVRLVITAPVPATAEAVRKEVRDRADALAAASGSEREQRAGNGRHHT